jgi:hypothetical protein
MGRYVMEHLPRAAARYQVTPLDHAQAKRWLQEANTVSLVRTTEMIAAIRAGLEITLVQSADSIELRSGDEALLITLSFNVLLAWAEGELVPLPEDWRCASLTVQDAADGLSPVRELAVAEDVRTDEPV